MQFVAPEFCYANKVGDERSILVLFNQRFWVGPRRLVYPRSTFKRILEDEKIGKTPATLAHGFRGSTVIKFRPSFVSKLLIFWFSLSGTAAD